MISRLHLSFFPNGLADVVDDPLDPMDEAMTSEGSIEMLVVTLLSDDESTPNPTGYRPPRLNACLNPGWTAIQCPLSTLTDHRDLTHVDVRANRGDVLFQFVLPHSFC